MKGAKPQSLSQDPDTRTKLEALAKTDALLQTDSEMASLLNALDGRFIRPAPGGDLLRTPEILPTGRKDPKQPRNARR